MYHNAVVWGGGNVAMDCARSLKRIVDNVTIVYRRSLKEMPANPAEIKAAEKEGVKVAFLTNIKEINRDENGKVCSISAIGMELGEMDASQLWETTLDPERRLLKRIEIEDARMASEITEMLMGTDVPPRKAFIHEHAHDAELDV